MPRGISTTALAEQFTAPVYFLFMDFPTPVRLTTGVTLAWDGDTYTNADFQFSGMPPSLSIYNEVLALGVTVLTDGTAGRAVTLWQAYKDAGASSSLFGHTEPVVLFHGEMSEATIGDRIEIQTRRWRPQFTPRRYMTAPDFNHLPKPGTVIETPTQKITLE